jgi:acyl-CoA reductase-like NAD-dependent aldehyde dehydrogenase
VKEAAEKFGMTRKELVTKAVANFISDAKRERRQAVLPSTPEQEQLIKDFQRRAGALRWKNVSPEERREFMQKMAEARWGSKKKIKRDQPKKAAKRAKS